MPLEQPIRDHAAQFWKMSREEVIPALDNSDFRTFFAARRKLLDHRAQLLRRAELIELTVDQEFRLVAAVEIRKTAVAQVADRQAQTDQFRNARVAAPGAQAHPRTKAEACEQQRCGMIFLSEK